MSAPPLPDILPILGHPQDAQRDDTSPIPDPIGGGIIPFKRLKAGCWLLSYDPINSPSSVIYDGTFRVERLDGGLRASGDLYQRPTIRLPILGPRPRTVIIPGPPPNPADGIPILAINRYAFFIRATRLVEAISFGNTVELGLELYQYSHTATTTNPNIFPNVRIIRHPDSCILRSRNKCFVMAHSRAIPKH